MGARRVARAAVLSVLARCDALRLRSREDIRTSAGSRGCAGSEVNTGLDQIQVPLTSGLVGQSRPEDRCLRLTSRDQGRLGNVVKAYDSATQAPLDERRCGDCKSFQTTSLGLELLVVVC